MRGSTLAKMASKLKSIVVLVALTFTCKVNANTDDLKHLASSADTKNSMTWPMLPGESLTELAIKFYPDSQFMQRQFIFKTQYLSKESLPDLQPGDHFAAPTVVIVPTFKSLSSHAGLSKKVDKNAGKGTFRLTTNIASSIRRLPRSLFQDYENLVLRNDFLKVEIAKLNEKLTYLKNKLSNLKLIFERTLTLPTQPSKLPKPVKKVFKNLDAEEAEKKPTVAVPVVTKSPVAKEQTVSFFSFSNKLLWLGALAFGVIAFLVSYLLKKYRERKYIQFLDMVTQQEAATSFSFGAPKAEPKKEDDSTRAPINAEAKADGSGAASVLEEAKAKVAEDLPEEAIECLKLAIKVKPKSAINIWLYLLNLLKVQNLKEDFEKVAFDMHQTFNVMTPLWESKKVAMIVPKSLEEFPHIIELLTEKWPHHELVNYLQHVIADNRDGERSGFSQEVIEDILLLIAILESHTEET